MDITQALAYISEHLTIIVAVLVPLEALTIVFLLLFAWRSGRQARRVGTLLRTPNGGNLEGMIANFLAEAEKGTQEREELSQQLAALRDTLRLAVQHIGFVRYNAFPGVGGELSFSIVALDGRLDGFILTSIFGREEARVYAKLIKDGKAKSTLSDEEQSAVSQATRASSHQSHLFGGAFL